MMRYSMQFGLQLIYMQPPPPSPLLCDQSFINTVVCLLFLTVFFQIRPKYSAWVCKCQAICTWQIRQDLAKDGFSWPNDKSVCESHILFK